MQIANQKQSSTSTAYDVIATSQELAKFKTQAFSEARSSVKVPGFRPGKAPDEMVEKYSDAQSLQNDFLNLAVNELYLDSTDQLKLKVVNEPEIKITKFVPYSTLEFSVQVAVITKVEIPNYRNFKVKQESLEVTKQQLDNTIDELRRRGAKYSDVDRAAKLGDRVVIDFKGKDTTTKEELAQAGGMDYQLLLGSKSFVSGFEEKLIGLKAGDSKTFSLTFPKDYHEKSFQSRKVTFEVSIKQVQNVELPKLDDQFAASVGPFKTTKEMQSELKKQLKAENDRQSMSAYEDRILSKLAETTKVDIPSELMESELSRLENDARQGVVQRGQTWQEFLASSNTDEAGYREQLKTLAELRIKGGLAIGEIAAKENIKVEQAELEAMITELKKQYPDEQMRAELDKPASRREILMRLLSDKVLNYLKGEISKANK